LTLLDTTGTVTLSLSDLSRRFDVTHLHVRRVLKRAHDEGFIVYQGRGHLTAAPAGAHIIALHYAFQLSELIGSARHLLP
jgi:Mn-dependent DtxR family transcriptional regulator